MGESSVNPLFIATVKEADFYVVQRALNREIKLIFDENNVCIPYPQITINEPGKFDNKTSSRQSKKQINLQTNKGQCLNKWKTQTN